MSTTGAKADGWSTTSFVATTDTDAGSGSTTDSSESDAASGADSESGFAGGSHFAHLRDAQAGELGQP